MNNSIEIQSLSYRYEDGTEALKTINLNIKENSKVAILGHNGAGKSTLLLHFNGVHLAQRGSVIVKGQHINKKNIYDVRQKVGVVFQDPDDQVFSSSVYEDIAFGLENMGMDEKQIEKKIMKMAQILSIEDILHKNTFHLSYGQKKKVAFAGVMVMEPEIIVLDEPTAFIDPEIRQKIFNVLEEYHQKGHTIIITTHDINFAAEWADEYIVMQGGKIIGEGNKEIFMDKNILREGKIEMPIVTKLFVQAELLKDKCVPFTLKQGVEILKHLTLHKK